MSLPAFHFKKFSLEQAGAAHPVGTDAVLLGAWAEQTGARRMLDIGTGTGVVLLMLAQRMEPQGGDWAGVGVELHPASAALASRNVSASPWASHLTAWEGSIQAFASDAGNSPLTEAFDLIVSNPPFFSELTTSPHPERNLGRHTASLSPGALLASAKQLLTPKGKFCVVLPEREGRRLCELAVPMGLYWTHIVQVRSRPGKPVERLLLQFEKDPYAIRSTELCIYAAQPEEGYSSEFRALTRDYYLAG